MDEVRCEGCGARTPNDRGNPYALFDYCARCGRNLCDRCMRVGCCGVSPADDGAADDHDVDEANEHPV